MTYKFTASNSINSSSIGSIRKAAFDQRKCEYLRSTHDRTAVFIKPSNINNDYVVPRKNT